MKGKVKFFNDMRGFGFIAADDGKEYFVHMTGLKDNVTIQENDDVEFEVETEEEQVDLQERKDPGHQVPGDVEDGERSQRRRADLRLVGDVPEELADANRAVMVRVEEIEANRGFEAPADTGPGDPEV